MIWCYFCGWIEAAAAAVHECCGAVFCSKQCYLSHRDGACREDCA